LGTTDEKDILLRKRNKTPVSSVYQQGARTGSKYDRFGNTKKKIGKLWHRGWAEKSNWGLLKLHRGKGGEGRRKVEQKAFIRKCEERKSYLTQNH